MSFVIPSEPGAFPDLADDSAYVISELSTSGICVPLVLIGCTCFDERCWNSVV